MLDLAVITPARGVLTGQEHTRRVSPPGRPNCFAWNPDILMVRPRLAPVIMSERWNPPGRSCAQETRQFREHGSDLLFPGLLVLIVTL